MEIQTVLNSHWSTELAIRLGRNLPPRLGYHLANSIAGWIAARKNSRIVQVMQANQWVVGDGKPAGDPLDRLTRAAFINAGTNIYELYHSSGNPEEIRRLVRFSGEFERWVETLHEEKSGKLLVFPHLSNFDLAGFAMGLRGLQIQVLSYPQPPKGYRRQNELRNSAGLEMTPISASAIRKATLTLEAGGTVMTGIDRPITDAKYQPCFFGRPASLPVYHVRLALKTGATVTAIACQRQTDGTYLILASDPIPMRTGDDLVSETVQNAEAVLRVLEGWIRQTPDQWAMFYPVWPEAILEMRGNP